MKKIDEYGNIIVEPDNRKELGKLNLEETFVLCLGKKMVGDYEITVSIEKETDAAIQLKFITSHSLEIMEEGEKLEDFRVLNWVPKSLVTYTEDGLEVPRWFANKNRFHDYGVKKSIYTEVV